MTPAEIYLDHAATSPVTKRARRAWIDATVKYQANPTGSHAAARRARQALDVAREKVALALGAQPGEIVFTSGGSESDNLAITGSLGRYREQFGVMEQCAAVTTVAEHHAVLNPVERSMCAKLVDVDSRGVVKRESLANVLESTPTVAVVSLIAVNNETGSITPLRSLVRLVRRLAPEALLHTDAVQAVKWTDVAADAAKYDLISISGHKIGAPVGIGVLIVRNHVDIEPLIVGGGQERGRRAGTPNVAGAVAFAEAILETVAEREQRIKQVRLLQDQVFTGLSEKLGDRLVISAAERHPSERHTSQASEGHHTSQASEERDPLKRAVQWGHIAAGIAHVCIAGVSSEALLFLIDKAGVRASSASSCASGAQQTSHVLTAMGIPGTLANGALRLSFGYDTTESEIEKALQIILESVKRLDKFNGG